MQWRVQIGGAKPISKYRIHTSKATKLPLATDVYLTHQHQLLCLSMRVCP